MSIKIRIKVDVAEIEYEGSEDFFKAELSNILNSVAQLQSSVNLSNGVSGTVEDNQTGGRESQHASSSESSVKTPKLEMTTNNIAAKLSAKTGPDLVMAACARLTLVLEHETFKRDEILKEMKEATSYYGANYSKNLSSYLNQLVKDNKLRERSNDVFALQAEQRQQLETQIAK